MTLLIGKQECSVDDKRRFSLPPKFRDSFPGRASDSRGQPAVILPWYQGGLAVIPMPYWNEIESRIELLDTAIRKYAEIKNMVLARAERMETDPEGRFTLTPENCEWIRIEPGKKSRVVVAGQSQLLMVWNLEEHPDVVRTGNNPANRTSDDLKYEEALEKLMTQGLTAREERNREESARGSVDSS